MSILLEYGKRIALECKEKRSYQSMEINENEPIVDQFISYLTKLYSLENAKFDIVERKTEVGFSMKFHVDDRLLIKGPSRESDISLSETYQLRKRGTKTPFLSCILYLSSYDTDFTGGEFEFVDETIYPIKYHVLVFDSREVHRVNNVKYGVRHTILVKWY
jgi:hypothetical protein